MKTVFNSVQELYENMIDNCRYFSLSVNQNTSTNKTAVFGEIVFGKYEFDSPESGNNRLQFWQSTGEDGANLTLHNVTGGYRVGNPNDTEIFEYGFYLRDMDEPFTMLAYGWNKGCRI